MILIFPATRYIESERVVKRCEILAATNSRVPRVAAVAAHEVRSAQRFRRLPTGVVFGTRIVGKVFTLDV